MRQGGVLGGGAGFASVPGAAFLRLGAGEDSGAFGTRVTIRW